MFNINLLPADQNSRFLIDWKRPKEVQKDVETHWFFCKEIQTFAKALSKAQLVSDVSLS